MTMEKLKLILCVVLTSGVIALLTTLSVENYRGNAYRFAESETETAGTATLTVDTERQPGDITSDGSHQVIPTFEVTADSHQNYINFINKFNSNIKPGDVRQVENYYGLKEGVVACITFAETSVGTKGYGTCNNVGNVGNNDRGDRNCYATVQGGLEAIGYTLNNTWLGDKQTLGCLSNAGHCKEENDNGKRRASSMSTRENNMVACLEAIYQQEIDASTFNIRR